MTAAAALAFTIASTAIGTSSDVSVQADGCHNGVTVLNPYANSCTLPGPVHKIRGSAPDANAIIACRHHPGCLSWYVNNP
jgi:hypothetical protein